MIWRRHVHASNSIAACNFVIFTNVKRTCSFCVFENATYALSRCAYAVCSFFVSVILYLAAGVAYQFKVKQATGSDLIPNREMWTGLWRLAKVRVLVSIYYICLAHGVRLSSMHPHPPTHMDTPLAVSPMLSRHAHGFAVSTVPHTPRRTASRSL